MKLYKKISRILEETEQGGMPFYAEELEELKKKLNNVKSFGNDTALLLLQSNKDKLVFSFDYNYKEADNNGNFAEWVTLILTILPSLRWNYKLDFSWEKFEGDELLSIDFLYDTWADILEEEV